MEDSAVEMQTIEDIVYDLEKGRCILFLGPYLPVYPVSTEKLDFYSVASLHLTELLVKANYNFDISQSQNLFYIAQKFISFKKNYRTRLEDEIAALYKIEIEKVKSGNNSCVPEIYNKILKLPWHTIVNTQPESCFKESIS